MQKFTTHNYSQKVRRIMVSKKSLTAKDTKWEQRRNLVEIFLSDLCVLCGEKEVIL